jgi:hypothetical protein
VNAQSSNAIVADRTATVNGNGFVLGTSGAGKGVAAKNEITSVALDRLHDDIIIIDPEHEYEPIATAFGAEVIRIFAGSDQRINPMDIELDVQTGDGDPILAKCEFVLTLLDALIGGSRNDPDPALCCGPCSAAAVPRVRSHPRRDADARDAPGQAEGVGYRRRKPDRPRPGDLHGRLSRRLRTERTSTRRTGSSSGTSPSWAPSSAPSA